MKRNNESIRYRFTTRLMVGLALLTLVPVITMSLFTNLFTNRLMMKSARKQTSGDLANAVNHFDSIINTYISSVKTLSVDESLVRLLRDKPDTQEASSMVYEKLYLIMGTAAANCPCLCCLKTILFRFPLCSLRNSIICSCMMIGEYFAKSKATGLCLLLSPMYI